MMLGTGTRIVATEKLHSQGSLINTENALDLAIQGEGSSNSSTRRDWHTPESGLSSQILVRWSRQDARLQPPLTVPQNVSGLTIGADGTVPPPSLAAGSNWEVQITRFLNTAGLEPLGRNLFRRQPLAVLPGAALRKTALVLLSEALRLRTLTWWKRW